MTALSTAPASGLLAVPDRPLTIADARVAARAVHLTHCEPCAVIDAGGYALACKRFGKSRQEAWALVRAHRQEEERQAVAAVERSWKTAKASK